MAILKDSGERSKFNTGAVRDMQKGKGRCDLMPLEMVSEFLVDKKWVKDKVLERIEWFQRDGEYRHLFDALCYFASRREWDHKTMLLEVAVHFEDGAEKYGENNWQKGIPTRCYINSAVRHYLKWLRGDDDEPHDRAFCWNIMCCAWTCRYLPELNDYAKRGEEKK